MKRINILIIPLSVGLVLFIVIILLAIIFGTTLTPSIEDSLRMAKLEPLNNYRVIDSAIESSIGDYMKNYTLVISRSDYMKLDSQIRKKPFFIEYDSSAFPKGAYDTDSDWSKINEVAYSINGNTYYERFDPHLGEDIGIALKNDTLLIVGYQKL